MHTYLHWAAFVAVIALIRFGFLLFAPAMRGCSWCNQESSFCLRCRGAREHFRLGARTARRVRVSLRNARQEALAARAARKLEDYR